MSTLTQESINHKPALLGGPPVRTESFPSWPISQPGMIEKLTEVLNSGEWGVGSPFISDFEKSFAKYIGVEHCHSCTNGTQAILVSLQALGVQPGDEVLTTPYTFIGTVSPIMALHAIPRFVDISDSDYLMDLDKLESMIGDNTKAIVVVHLAGCPLNMERVMDIARKHNLSVIEDCAQAHGAEWKGRKVGSWGDLGTFSFQTSKNMSAGEGGAITTNDDDLAVKVFGAKNCGRVPGGRWYMHESFGTNLRLSAFQAALLTEQIDRIDSQNETRDKNAHCLSQLLEEMNGIDVVALAPEGVTSHARHLVLFRYDSSGFEGLSREKYLEAAVAEGIPIASGYVPLDRQGAMREFEQWSTIQPILKDRGIDYRKQDLPITNRVADETGMWIHQSALLGDEKDMESIVLAFRKIQNHAKDLAKNLE